MSAFRPNSCRRHAVRVLSGSADGIPTMSAGFDISQEIASSLGSHQGAWGFIGRFAERWLTPLTEDDGWAKADLQAAEQRLGVRLPPAIHEAYGLFGRRGDLTSVQDRLLGPKELAVDAAGDVLVYRVENQAVDVWGVPLAALEQPDPPVLVANNFEVGSWEPYLERFRWRVWRWCCRSRCILPVGAERQPGVGPGRRSVKRAALRQAGDSRLSVVGRARGCGALVHRPRRALAR